MLGRILLLLCVLGCAQLSAAQAKRITFAAGTPEDMALAEIGREQDQQALMERYRQFVEQFSGNPSAVAYGNAELARLYAAAGQKEEALAAADKAAEAMPTALDILTSLAGAAQTLGDNPRVVQYAALGAAAFHAIGKERPEGVDEEAHQAQVRQEREGFRQSYEYLEGAAFSAIAAENDPRQRMEMIERFTPAFPGSRYAMPVSQYAMYSLQQLKDSARLITYGEKTLESDPENVPTLIMLAETYAENPKQLAKAVEYARNAVKLSQAEEASDDPSRKLLAGMARSVLGMALLNQGNTKVAIPELAQASELLKENAAAQSVVLYRLGFAYAKLNRYADARRVLAQGAKVEGPAQQLCRDLLQKVEAAQKRPR